MSATLPMLVTERLYKRRSPGWASFGGDVINSMVKPRVALTVAVTFSSSPASGSSRGTARMLKVISESPSTSMGTVKDSTISTSEPTGRTTEVTGVPLWYRRRGDQPSAATERSTVTSRVPTALRVMSALPSSPLSTPRSSGSASRATL